MTFIPLDASLRPFQRTERECHPRIGSRFSPIRHFKQKRDIFFVRGKAKDVRGTASGKHPAPCAPEERCFRQTDSRMKQKMANEKDPSAALGMTIREYRFPQRRCEITIISFSRSICLGGLAALIGVTGKPYPSCLSYHSHPIRPCGHLPLEGKAAIREYHLLKRRRSRHLNPEP